MTDLIPEVVSTSRIEDTPGAFSAGGSLALVGNYLYAAESGGIRVTDVGRPWDPKPSVAIPLEGGSQGLYAVKGHVYVGRIDASLLTLDARDLESPTAAGRHPTGAPLLDLQTTADHAFLAVGSAGIEVLDVTNPLSPKMVATLGLPGPAQQLAFAEGRLHVAAGRAGLQVVDVSSPTRPHLVGSRGTGSPATAVAALGRCSCVVASGRSLLVFFVGADGGPIRIGSCDLPIAQQDSIAGIRVWDTFALVWATNRNLFLVDLRHPSHPEVLPMHFWGDPVRVTDVQVASGYAYCATQDHGLLILEVRRLGNQRRAQAVDTPGVARALCVKESHCYVADGSAGLQVFVFDEDGTVLAQGSHPGPQDAWDIDVQGDTAFVADSRLGLLIVDVSDRRRPTLLGQHRTLDPARAVRVSGTRAYLACDRGGLLILDVSDPGDVHLLAQKSTPGARNLQVNGNIVYLADYRGGFWSVNIEDLTFLLTVGRLGTVNRGDHVGLARDVEVIGPYAFLASFTSGLRVLDLHEATRPVVVAEIAHSAYSVSADAHSLLTSFGQMLVSYDVANPEDLRPLHQYCLGSTPWDVQVHQGRAFLAMGEGGLLILDMAAPPAFAGPPVRTDAGLVLNWMGGAHTTLETVDRLAPGEWRSIPESTGRVRWQSSLTLKASFFRLADAPPSTGSARKRGTADPSEAQTAEDPNLLSEEGLK